MNGVVWSRLPGARRADEEIYTRLIVEKSTTAGGLLERIGSSSPDGAICLGYSGGGESALLARALAGRRFHPLLLQTPQGGRDREPAIALARELGIAVETVLLDEAELLLLIEEYREALQPLADYTQRILALCELALARAAFERGAALVLGHGPEALFGGFQRHATPDLSRPDTVTGRLWLNVSRLDRVAAAVNITLHLPFLDPAVFALLASWRRSGRDKPELIASHVPAWHAPQIKSSLQNGSGVHYLFVALAKRAGERYVRDHMERLLA